MGQADFGRWIGGIFLAVLMVGCSGGDNGAQDGPEDDTAAIATDGSAETVPDGTAGSVDEVSASLLTLAEQLSEDDRFHTLSILVELSGLTDDLAAAGPFTLFAPSEAAFADLPAGTLDELRLPQHRQELAALLSHHVVEGRPALSPGDELMTLAGTLLSVSQSGDVVVIDDAVLLPGEVQAENGWILLIDRVLLPQQSAQPSE